MGGAVVAAALITLVATWEGKSNNPYKDLVGVWTVCYGETRVEMRPYTDAQCEEMLAKGLNEFAGPVLKRNPNLKDRPNQLVAAVSLAYNVGGANYNRSTTAKRFARGDWRGGCEAIKRWNLAGRPLRVVRGLVNRRAAEYKICMTGL
jgi:lysozyme